MNWKKCNVNTEERKVLRSYNWTNPLTKYHRSSYGLYKTQLILTTVPGVCLQSRFIDINCDLWAWNTGACFNCNWCFCARHKRFIWIWPEQVIFKQSNTVCLLNVICYEYVQCCYLRRATLFFHYVDPFAVLSC